MSHKQPSSKHIADIARTIKDAVDAQDAIIRQMWEVTQAAASGHLTSATMVQARQIVANPEAQAIIRDLGATFSFEDHLPPMTPIQQLDEGKFQRVLEELTDD
jgi:hypothetical protein